ncbi:MAG: alkaline phosphatase [Burkholderiales bacterium]|jgi:alkaline phosphatase|nr:alkaline phosphatase [Burkholderiales bacterium]
MFNVTFWQRLMMRAILMGAFLISGSVWAQTIYPIDRATMVAGGQFDFKVEFSSIVSLSDVNISINGKDYQQLLGKNVEFIEREEGENASALWIRRASLAKPGQYQVTVQNGHNQAKVTWEVFATPKKPLAKNVILFIGDGLSVAHRTGARILSKGVTQGKANAKLAMDDLPYMATVGTSGTDSIAADSANTMSAYMTGHKSAANAMGVYESRAKNSLAHPQQETLAELIKRTTKMSVGVVTDAEIEDATPAAVVAHTRRRSDKAEIVNMFFKVQPEVILGGGAAYFLPKSTQGSKRDDEINYIQKFQDAGYTFVQDALSLEKQYPQSRQLLGLFHPGNLNDVLDRRFNGEANKKQFSNQPDLTEMTKAALDVLSKNKNGFFLMVESALIDKASHRLDWERAFYNTIMLDQSVAIAKKFAETHPDTLIIVTGDHTHALSIVGTVDDDKPGNEMRDKVGVYQNAGYPNYKINANTGYPEDVNVSKRLAVFFAAYPDHYETFRPVLEGAFSPSVKNENGQYVANPVYKNIRGAMWREGNLPKSEGEGIHAVDEMIVQGMGPGAGEIKGYLDNTDLFRIIVQSLALGEKR